MGEVSETGADLSFVPVSQRENITLSVDISGLQTLECIRNKIAESLCKKHLYKVVLTGHKESGLFIDTLSLADALSEQCMFIKIRDHSSFVLDNRAESVLEKHFIERLSKRDDAIGRRALAAGLLAFGRQQK